MSLRKFASDVAAAALVSVIGLAAQAEETLKIGVIAPLTGAGAAWGTAAKVAAEIVGDAANAQGGLDVGGTKHMVEVIAYDDQ